MYATCIHGSLGGTKEILHLCVARHRLARADVKECLGVSGFDAVSSSAPDACIRGGRDAIGPNCAQIG